MKLNLHASPLLIISCGYARTYQGVSMVDIFVTAAHTTSDLQLDSTFYLLVVINCYQIFYDCK